MRSDVPAAGVKSACLLVLMCHASVSTSAATRQPHSTPLPPLSLHLGVPVAVDVHRSTRTGVPTHWCACSLSQAEANRRQWEAANPAATADTAAAAAAASDAPQAYMPSSM